VALPALGSVPTGSKLPATAGSAGGSLPALGTVPGVSLPNSGKQPSKGGGGLLGSIGHALGSAGGAIFGTVRQVPGVVGTLATELPKEAGLTPGELLETVKSISPAHERHRLEQAKARGETPGWHNLKKSMPLVSGAIESLGQTARQIPDTAIGSFEPGVGFGKTNLGRQVKQQGVLNTTLAKVGDLSLLAGGAGMLGKAANLGRLADAAHLEEAAAVSAKAAGLAKGVDAASVAAEATKAAAAGDVERAVNLGQIADKLHEAETLRAAGPATVGERATAAAVKTGHLGARIAGGPAEVFTKPLGAAANLIGKIPGVEEGVAHVGEALHESKLGKMNEARKVLKHATAENITGEQARLNHEPIKAVKAASAAVGGDKTSEAAVILDRMGTAKAAGQHLAGLTDEELGKVLGVHATPESFKLAHDYAAGRLAPEVAAQLDEAGQHLERGVFDPKQGRFLTGYGEQNKPSATTLSSRAHEVEKPLEPSPEGHARETARRQAVIGARSERVTSRLKAAADALDKEAPKLSTSDERLIARKAEAARRAKLSAAGEAARSDRLAGTVLREQERNATTAANREGQVMGRGRERMLERDQLDTGVESRAKQADLAARRAEKAAAKGEKYKVVQEPKPAAVKAAEPSAHERMVAKIEARRPVEEARKLPHTVSTDGWRVTKVGDHWLVNGPDRPQAYGGRLGSEAEAQAVLKKEASKASHPLAHAPENVALGHGEMPHRDGYTGDRYRVVLDSDGNARAQWQAGDDGQWHGSLEPAEEVAALRAAAQKTGIKAYADTADRIDAAAAAKPASKLTKPLSNDVPVLQQDSTRGVDAAAARAAADEIKGIKGPRSRGEVQGDVSRDSRLANQANKIEGAQTQRHLSGEATRQGSAQSVAEARAGRAGEAAQAAQERADTRAANRLQAQKDRASKALADARAKYTGEHVKAKAEAGESLAAAPPAARATLYQMQDMSENLHALADKADAAGDTAKAIDLRARADALPRTLKDLQAAGVEPKYVYGGKEAEAGAGGGKASPKLQGRKGLDSSKLRESGAAPKTFEGQGLKAVQNVQGTARNEFSPKLAKQMGNTTSHDIHSTAGLTGRDLGNALKGEGYKPWDPNGTGRVIPEAQWDTLKPGVEIIPREYAGRVDQLVRVPKGEAETMGQMLKKTGLSALDKTSQAGRFAKLLEPGWQVKKMLGDPAMLAAMGVGPADVAAHAGAAFKAVREGDYTPHLGATHEGRMAMEQPGSKLGRGVRKTANGMFTPFQKADALAREIAYRAKLEQGLSPQAAAAAVRRGLGDLHDMTASEASIARRVFTFYPWQKHVAQTLLRVGVEHPAGVAQAAHLQQLANPGGKKHESQLESSTNPFNSSVLSMIHDSAPDKQLGAVGSQVNPVVRDLFGGLTGASISHGLSPISTPGQKFGAGPQILFGLKHPEEFAKFVGHGLPPVVTAQNLLNTKPAAGGKIPARFETGEPIRHGTKNTGRPKAANSGARTKADALRQIIGIEPPPPKAKKK
jgi:hypothetical protein